MESGNYEFKDGKWVEATPIKFEGGIIWKFKEFLKKTFKLKEKSV